MFKFCILFLQYACRSLGFQTSKRMQYLHTLDEQSIIEVFKSRPSQLNSSGSYIIKGLPCGNAQFLEFPSERNPFCLLFLYFAEELHDNPIQAHLGGFENISILLVSEMPVLNTVSHRSNGQDRYILDNFLLVILA